MSKHSRVSPRFSPLLWLVPMPFVLAAFLPVDLPRENPQVVAQQAASAPAADRTDR